jgi:hypothetical protein
VGLEKDVEDQLERQCEDWRVSKNQGGKEHPLYNKTKKG